MSFINDALDNAANLLIQESGNELKAQGHLLTGNAAASLSKQISTDTDGFTITISGNDYLLILDNGVSASRIPFTPGGGKRGGTSLYIQGLKEFALRRGMASTDKEALSIAFAIAHKHKIQWSSAGYGMPTAGSYRFSSNGARTGWTTRVLNKTTAIIAESIASALWNDFVNNITKEKELV